MLLCVLKCTIQTAILWGGQVHSRSVATQFHVYPLRVRGAAEGPWGNPYTILGGKNDGFPGQMFPSTNPWRRVAKLYVISCFLVCKDFRLELADRTTYH